MPPLRVGTGDSVMPPLRVGTKTCPPYAYMTVSRAVRASEKI